MAPPIFVLDIGVRDLKVTRVVFFGLFQRSDSKD